MSKKYHTSVGAKLKTFYHSYKKEFNFATSICIAVVVLLSIRLFKGIFNKIKSSAYRADALRQKNLIEPLVVRKKAKDGTEKLAESLSHIKFRAYPFLRWPKERLEIHPLNSQVTEEDCKNLLRWLSELHNTSYADCKKVSRGFFRKHDCLVLYYERFPAKISWTESCPNLNPLEVYWGPDAFGKSLVTSTREESVSAFCSAPGGGKTFAAYSYIASFSKTDCRTQFLIASTKIQTDYFAFKDDSRFRLYNPDLDSDLRSLLKAIVDLKSEIQRRSTIIAEAKVKHASDLPDNSLPPIAVILDEARSYLSLSTSKSNKERLEIVKQLIAEVDFIIRTSRFASINILILSQSELIDELDVSLRLAQTLFCSKTGTAQASKQLFGSDIAYDSSLRAGKFICKTKDGIFKVKIAYFDPHNDFVPIGSDDTKSSEEQHSQTESPVEAPPQDEAEEN